MFMNYWLKNIIWKDGFKDVQSFEVVKGSPALYVFQLYITYVCVLYSLSDY